MQTTWTEALYGSVCRHAHLHEVVKCHEKREQGVHCTRGAGSEWAVAESCNVVQCEAKMALEYLIFYLTSAKYGHLPCKQHEPRLQATHCIYSTQGIYSPKSFNLLPCKAWAPTLVNILNELGGCMWVFLHKLMSELVSNVSAQHKPGSRV